jgi:hypothetical protein
VCKVEHESAVVEVNANLVVEVNIHIVEVFDIVEVGVAAATLNLDVVRVHRVQRTGICFRIASVDRAADTACTAVTAGASLAAVTTICICISIAVVSICIRICTVTVTAGAALACVAAVASTCFVAAG